MLFNQIHMYVYIDLKKNLSDAENTPKLHITKLLLLAG